MHSSTQDTPASTSAAGPLEAADPADAAIDVGVAADDAAAADAAAPTADRAFHERPGGSRQVWRRLAADRWALAGGAVVIATTLVALLAPWITRVLGVDPYTYHLDLLAPSGIPAGRFGGISAAHPFGVEPQTGRDLFAVVVEGTRTSFSIGMGATVLSMLIAISLGLSAGYLGGWWDAIVSRLTDITLGFPHLVFMIAISAIIPATAPRVPVMILIIGILGWPSTARVLRSRTMGAGGLHIMTTQVLPNLVATIIVLTTISIPGKITAEAALSFLGVGVPPPTPSWGRSIGSAITWVATDPWYLVFPGAALFLVTLAFNLFGDGLRDALDPRTGEHR